MEGVSCAFEGQLHGLVFHLCKCTKYLHFLEQIQHIFFAEIHDINPFDLNWLLLFLFAFAELPLSDYQLFVLFVQLSFESSYFLYKPINTVVYLFFWTYH